MDSSIDDIMFMVKDATYRTTYSTFSRKEPEFKFSYGFYNPSRSRLTPISNLYKRTVLPLKTGDTEYMNKYKYPALSEPVVGIEKLKTPVHQGIMIHRRKLNPFDYSIMKHMDPYISVSHLMVENSTQMCKDDDIFPTREGYRKISSKFHQPIFDRSVLSCKPTFRNWVPPPQSLRNTGMQSETNYQYSRLTNVCSSINQYVIKCENIAPRVMSDVNYFTEYDHIGRKWPVRAVVDPG